MVYEINHTESRVPDYLCLSTDTKPTTAIHPGVDEPKAGSTCYVYTIATDDTEIYITYDGTNWVKKKMS